MTVRIAASLAILLTSSLANAVPSGVVVDSLGDQGGVRPVPSMRKARGFTGVLELDGPGCTVAEDDPWLIT